MRSFTKFIAVGTVAAAALVTANAASAAEIFIDKAGIFKEVDVHANRAGAPAYHHNDWSGIFELQVNDGIGPGSPIRTIYGFCTDIFASITVGFNKFITENLQYHVDVLNTGYHGQVITLAQIDEIKGLANAGYAIRTHLGSYTDPYERLAAIQGAIWQIEDPTLSLVYYGPGAAGAVRASKTQAFLSHYIAVAPLLNPKGAYEIKPDLVGRGSTQPFIIGGPIPEPSTWALMIGGFGLIGATLRRRRVVAI